MSETEKYFRAFCILGEVFGFERMDYKMRSRAGFILSRKTGYASWFILSASEKTWREDALDSWRFFLNRTCFEKGKETRYLHPSYHDAAEIALRLEEEGLTDYGFIEEIKP